MSTKGRKRIVGPLNREVAKLLKARYESGTYSRQAILEVSGFPEATFTKLLNGTMVMDLDQLERICRGLSLPIHDVIATALAAVEGKESGTGAGREGTGSASGSVVAFPGRGTACASVEGLKPFA